MLRPFSHPRYHENERRCGDSQTSCAVCGKGIDEGKAAVWVYVGDGNCRFLTPAEAEQSDDAGAWPIGSACYRRHKKELERYVHAD
jgi:hypothetical protein